MPYIQWVMEALWVSVLTLLVLRAVVRDHYRRK